MWALHVLSTSKTSKREAFIILKELWDVIQWKLKSEFCIKSIHCALIYTLKSSICAAQIKAKARRAHSAGAMRDGGAKFTVGAAAVSPTRAEITFFLLGKNVCLARGTLITSYLSKHFIAQIWPICFLVPYGQQAVDMRANRPAASDRLQKVDCRRKTWFNQRGNNFHTVHLSLCACFKDHTVCLFFSFFFLFFRPICHQPRLAVWERIPHSKSDFHQSRPN